MTKPAPRATRCRQCGAPAGTRPLCSSCRSDTCDCGLAKAPGALACQRCTALDGRGRELPAAISALRVHGGRATAPDIAADAGWNVQHAWVALRRLRDTGRLIVREVEDPIRGEHTENWYALREPRRSDLVELANLRAQARARRAAAAVVAPVVPAELPPVADAQPDAAGGQP